MKGPRRSVSVLAAGLLAGLTITVPLGSAAAVNSRAAAPAAPTVSTYNGSLPNGATWLAKVPSNWNGTLLLYSHGYLPSFVGAPNLPAIAPDPATEGALLAEGYGLTGSSYAAAGWALNTAPHDQLETLTATIRAVGRRPETVLAVGTSMGGLVTAKLAEIGGTSIDGALSTCGIVGGGLALNNYQLDGQHAIAALLAEGQPIKLVNYASINEAFATTGALVGAVTAGQTTAAGRARVALAAALYQEPTWRPGRPSPPPPDDTAAVQRAMYEYLVQTLQFVTPGRFDIETAAGGNASWNEGVDYSRLLAKAELRDVVRKMYAEAGLDLAADLDRLTATASIKADPAAVQRLLATSVPTGEVVMPVLDLHTTDDLLVPVQHENAYANAVRRAGNDRLLRQAFVARQGHCAFTPSELVAAVHALKTRVDSGHWGNVAEASSLQRAALALNIGPAAFVRFRPPRLLRETSEDLPGRGGR